VSNIIPIRGVTRTPGAVAWPSTDIRQWQRDRLIAAGADERIVESTFPTDKEFRFLRRKEVERVCGSKLAISMRWPMTISSGTIGRSAMSSRCTSRSFVIYGIPAGRGRPRFISRIDDAVL
jgi:hypothetical protein